MNLCTFSTFLNFHFESDLEGYKYEDSEDEFIFEWNKKMKDSLKLAMVSDCLKINAMIAQLARKYSLKYLTAYIKIFQIRYTNSNLWFK